MDWICYSFPGIYLILEGRYWVLCSKIGAGGKSKLKTVMTQLEEEAALVIADGAAIGSEMNERYQGENRGTKNWRIKKQTFE